MNISELLAKFKDPEIIQSLSMADKMVAGLTTVFLGMCITFAALVTLLFIVSWMDKLLNKSKAESNIPSPDIQETLSETEPQPIEDDTELIAVISSVIAMNMTTSVDNIVIKNIEKIHDSTPTWSRAGNLDLMNSSL